MKATISRFPQGDGIKKAATFYDRDGFRTIYSPAFPLATNLYPTAL